MDGKSFQRLAFADIHHKRGAPDIWRNTRQFRKFGDEFDRQVIDRIIAQILEYFEHGTLAGTAKSGYDYQLAAIGFAWGSAP